MKSWPLAILCLLLPPSVLGHAPPPRLVPSSAAHDVVTNNGVAKTLSYDPNGNLVLVSNLQSQLAYDWDPAKRLVKITQLATGNPQLTSEFTYDGLGRRVRIIEKTNGVTQSDKRFLWVGLGLAEERDSTGATVTKRFFGQGEQISGTNYFFTRDHLGSVQEMTDASGAIWARYVYDPYGRRTSIAGSLEVDVGFTGHYYHAPSGLHLAPYRAYDADTGRWLNQDPIGESGGINLYSYAANNPVNMYDPLGLEVPPLGDDGFSMRYLIDSIKELASKLNELPTGSSEWKSAHQARARLYAELAAKRRQAQLAYEAARAREYAEASRAARLSRYCRVGARAGAVAGAGTVGAFTGYNIRNEVNNGFETIGALIWDLWYGNSYGTSVPPQPEPAMTVYFHGYYRR